ncbi:MAG: SDR family oxidoreductase, partial [Oscillospiraceae bacterium]|nr:SDR family oxidoreductase [Oscillospiraceae bacterium]
MKIAIVTGARRGIGLGITRLLAGNGYRVVMCAASPAEAAEETVSALLAEGLEVEYVSCDVSKDEDRRALITGTAEKYGRIDVLVNNAGYAYRSSIEEAEDEGVMQMYDTNFFGPVRLIQRVLPIMRAQGSGAIINVSSIGAVRTGAASGFYASSKAALE